MSVPKWLEKIARDPRIDSVSDEGEDGYWVYLKPGFWNPNLGCHMIHEWKREHVLHDFKIIEPCDCDECKRGNTSYIDPAVLKELKEKTK